MFQVMHIYNGGDHFKSIPILFLLILPTIVCPLPPEPVQHHFEWYYGTESVTVPNWVYGIQIKFKGQRAEVRANVPPEHNECMFEICLCNNFKNNICLSEFIAENYARDKQIEENISTINFHCAKMRPINGNIPVNFHINSRKFLNMINQNDDDLLIKLRRSFASKGFGCILTNDCDSDDEDFGPNGYLFYVKIAVESEKKVRSGLWVAQLKSPADRFEFIGETITEKSAEKIPKNKKDKTAKWTIHQEKRHA